MPYTKQQTVLASKMAEKQFLPTDWGDDDRMNFMFSAFPESREVNPKHWDSKLHYWSKAILDGCKHHGDICIDLTTLKRRFSRNGLTPLGLDNVLKELLQQGKIERKEQFINCAREGWLSWSYGFAKRSFQWSVGFVWEGSSDIKLDGHEQFVLVDDAKEKAQWILKQHHEHVECETTDHIIPWNVLKARCGNFDDQTLTILVAALQKQNKALVFITEEGEKVVKFARKGETKVAPVSDSDVEIVRLKKTLAILTLQVNKLTNEVEKCRMQAASFAKAGHRSKALKLLKRKELRQQTLDKTIASLHSLEEILHQIQNAHTNKTVLEALKSGATMLKCMHSDLSVEGVEEVMDEVNETLSISQDIDSAMVSGNSYISETTGMGSSELDELERELENLTIRNTATIAQAGSPPYDLSSGRSSIGHQHPSSLLSRQLDFAEGRTAVNLPDVPAHSPVKTGIPKGRDKTALLS